MGVLKFFKREKNVNSNGHTKDEETAERLSEEVTVYTTPYGTQYTLPTDILFSQEEKYQLLEEAEKEAARLAENNGEK
jgi:hypothetical protein